MDAQFGRIERDVVHLQAADFSGGGIEEESALFIRSYAQCPILEVIDAHNGCSLELLDVHHLEFIPGFIEPCKAKFPDSCVEHSPGIQSESGGVGPAFREEIMPGTAVTVQTVDSVIELGHPHPSLDVFYHILRQYSWDGHVEPFKARAVRPVDYHLCKVVSGYPYVPVSPLDNFVDVSIV